jgi:cobalt/nickel transport protein
MSAPAPLWRLAAAALAVALALALFGSPFASSSPDGLDRFTEDLDLTAAPAVWTQAPLADYALPGVAHDGAATGLAGGLGVLVVFAIGWALGAWLARRRQRSAKS